MTAVSNCSRTVPQPRLPTLVTKWSLIPENTFEAVTCVNVTVSFMTVFWTSIFENLSVVYRHIATLNTEAEYKQKLCYSVPVQ